jgi:hypothetical protein
MDIAISEAYKLDPSCDFNLLSENDMLFAMGKFTGNLMDYKIWSIYGHANFTANTIRKAYDKELFRLLYTIKRRNHHHKCDGLLKSKHPGKKHNVRKKFVF